MRLILLGAPGAGKGTISALLVDKYKIVQISTGDILRGEVKKGSPVGKQAAAYMQAGKLVPDEIILESMRSRLAMDDCANGFILDGFPRTIKQAEELKILLDGLGLKLDAVVNLEAPEEVLLRRLTSRRTCSNTSCQAIFNIYTKPPRKEGICDLCGKPVIQRDDETEAVIRTRLETYKEKTEPLIRYYSKEPVFFSVPCLDAKECGAAIVARVGK
jgi:adenylate kinase